MRLFRALLRYAAYPVITGGAVLFAVEALALGWPYWLIGAVVVTATCVLVAGLEGVIPYSPRWSTPRGDWSTDALHYAVSNRAVDVGALAATAMFAPVGGWLSTKLGSPLWPDGWPLGAQAVLALVAFELPWYWVHRLAHTWRPLWRVHSVHHSGERMYWWNVSRNHPLDNLVSTVVSVALLALLGVGEAPLAVAAAFMGAHGMLQHTNADLRTGFLDWAFATPRVHRWHHSPRAGESQANYGPTITLWDHVFGTRRFDPAAIPPEDVGLGPMPAPFPTGFVGQLKAPFDRKLWDIA